MKFTCTMGTSFTKLRLFFHQVSFVINILSLPSHETLFAGHINLFSEAYCISAYHNLQNSILKVHLSGP